MMEMTISTLQTHNNSTLNIFDNTIASCSREDDIDSLTAILHSQNGQSQTNLQLKSLKGT